MKKLIIISILALLFVSCQEFLEENPRSFVSAVNFYETEADAKAAIAGAYASLQNEYYGPALGMYAFMVLHSGAADGRGSQAPISIYDHPQIDHLRNLQTLAKSYLI